MGSRYECALKVSMQCTRGSGSTRKVKCSFCGGWLNVQQGTWSTFVWTGNGRYPESEAVGTYRSEKAADKATGGTLVVRFISATRTEGN